MTTAAGGKGRRDGEGSEDQRARQMLRENDGKAGQMDRTRKCHNSPVTMARAGKRYTASVLALLAGQTVGRRLSVTCHTALAQL